MTVIPCTEAADTALLQKYIKTYNTHPNIMQFNGKMLISTFSGEKCTFGQSSVDAGWMTAVKTGLPPVHFIPFFPVEPGTFGSYKSIDGAFNASIPSFSPSHTKPIYSGTVDGRKQMHRRTSTQTRSILLVSTGRLISGLYRPGSSRTTERIPTTKIGSTALTIGCSVRDGNL
jgi:hypothetical protein